MNNLKKNKIFFFFSEEKLPITWLLVTCFLFLFSCYESQLEENYKYTNVNEAPEYDKNLNLLSRVSRDIEYAIEEYNCNELDEMKGLEEKLQKLTDLVHQAEETDNSSVFEKLHRLDELISLIKIIQSTSNYSHNYYPMILPRSVAPNINIISSTSSMCSELNGIAIGPKNPDQISALEETVRSAKEYLSNYSARKTQEIEALSMSGIPSSHKLILDDLLNSVRHLKEKYGKFLRRKMGQELSGNNGELKFRAFLQRHTKPFTSNVFDEMLEILGLYRLGKFKQADEMHANFRRKYNTRHELIDLKQKQISEILEGPSNYLEERLNEFIKETVLDRASIKSQNMREALKKYGEKKNR